MPGTVFKSLPCLQRLRGAEERRMMGKWTASVQVARAALGARVGNERRAAGPSPGLRLQGKGQQESPWERVTHEYELKVERRGRLNVKLIRSQPCLQSYAHPSLPAGGRRTKLPIG